MLTNIASIMDNENWTRTDKTKLVKMVNMVDDEDENRRNILSNGE